MKLYKVTMTTVVMAKGVKDAAQVACDYAVIDTFDCKSEKIDSDDDLPEGWGLDSIPFFNEDDIEESPLDIKVNDLIDNN